MLASFIIPSYNSVQTVARCLDSIYALSLKPKEFEVIFIDDCSTDDTCEIVMEYQSQHANLVLLRQPENNRQGAARNRGVSIAKGEYICFVDSDDAVIEGVTAAIRIAKEKYADMVVLHYGYATEQGVVTSEAGRLSYTGKELFTGIEMQNAHPYWCSAPWGYIYSKDFLHRVNYPFAESVLYEDTDFIMVHLYQAKRMVYSQELGYIMYYREGSTTHSLTHKNMADYLLLGTRMKALYDRVVNDGVVCGVEEQKFAEGVLEGACWNIQKSCKRLIRLGNMQEVKAFYNRIDANVDRKELCANKHICRYYWNLWTSLCLRYMNITILLLAMVRPFYKLLKK